MKEVRNIRDRLRKKLCSEKGASLSYALLLFLVAAAVGSVVLTAATSASGRLAGLAEADQRYYSVTSAAELLKERYKLDEVSDEAIANMDNIALKRGFIMSGRRIDYERTGRTVLDEFRGGKIGRITLESAPV